MLLWRVSPSSRAAPISQDIAVEPDESVRIVVSQAPDWPGTIEVRNESVGGESPEALAGAGAGALAGGVWGLACGPLAPLCVPLGVVAGAEVGVVAGLAVGTTAALPEDKAGRLRDRVTRALQSHDLRGELEAAIVDRAKGHWNTTGTSRTSWWTSSCGSSFWHRRGTNESAAS